MKPRVNLVLSSAMLLALVVGLSGCKTVYYGALEKVGVHKRDILVDRVEDARDEQEEAKERFKSALEKFMEVTQFSGGSLEVKYNELKEEYESSQEKAETVGKRISDVESVAEDLFAEWDKELEQYTSKKLRDSSRRQLVDTQVRYSQLMGAMRRAETKIQPVLNIFRDQVLFLKHNLNARAIASLKTELASIETEIGQLIKEMELSINEADEFISEMK
ncbi:DUF2959 domain-containing protein [Verrucomicrobia bacterium]|nr:DUF2959 domain-containing protein [Verrucomicrobiota bacterium]